MERISGTIQRKETCTHDPSGPSIGEGDRTIEMVLAIEGETGIELLREGNLFVVE